MILSHQEGQGWSELPLKCKGRSTPALFSHSVPCQSPHPIILVRLMIWALSLGSLEHVVLFFFSAEIL